MNKRYINAAFLKCDSHLPSHNLDYSAQDCQGRLRTECSLPYYYNSQPWEVRTVVTIYNKFNGVRVWHVRNYCERDQASSSRRETTTFENTRRDQSLFPVGISRRDQSGNTDLGTGRRHLVPRWSREPKKRRRYPTRPAKRRRFPSRRRFPPGTSGFFLVWFFSLFLYCLEKAVWINGM